jgi:23S rRNA-/tRNA-specific pseudouridylate synthase
VPCAAPPAMVSRVRVGRRSGLRQAIVVKRMVCELKTGRRHQDRVALDYVAVHESPKVPCATIQ